MPALTPRHHGHWPPWQAADQEQDLPFSGSPRPRLHRSLRLIIAAGTAAAGLCLVIGSVAMVAAAGGTKARSTASSGRDPGPGVPASGHLPRGITGGTGSGHGTDQGGKSSYRVGRTLDKFQGTGSGERGKFNIPEPGLWGIAWSYSCPQTPGTFVLGQTNVWLTYSIDVNVHGAAGHGLTWITSAGRHSLVIVSGCTWQLRVVARAKHI
jgi:hypothetical protein